MFTMESTMTELLENESVRSFLEKTMPQMMQPPASDYIAAMSAAQVKEILPPEAQELMTAVVDIANGKEPSFVPQDPHTTPASVSLGRMNADYSIDDVDGPMYMLDHRFSGCILLQFSKNMQEEQNGVIRCGDTECPYVFTRVSAAGNIQLLGVFVRDLCREYDREYVLHLEGFIDEDGLVINPSDVSFRTKAENLPDPVYAEHDALALRAAAESIVLLRNENGLLPLKPQPLAVYGADTFRTSAVGAGKINPRYTKHLLPALAEDGFADQKDADTALVVISRASGENYDNNACEGEYYLSAKEKEDLRQVTASHAHVIVLINSGYPMDVRWLEEYGIEAALWCGFPGMLGAAAAADILCGKVNPSGRLPDTWSLDYKDHPSSANFYQPENPQEALDADHDIWINTVYEEDIYIGYRYFDTFRKPVAYPFGHGLSYTSFEKKAVLKSASLNALKADDEITFEISVTNTGKAAGKEVAAVYVSQPETILEHPAHQLAAFAKTRLLEPGETQVLQLSAKLKYLAGYDEASSAWMLEKGRYTFFCGGSVSELKEFGTLDCEQPRILLQTGDYCRPGMDFRRLSAKHPQFPEGKLSGIAENVHELLPKRTCRHVKENSLADMAEVNDYSLYELARISVCASAGWGMQQKGEAGRIFRLKGRDIPAFACADGNSGVNVNHRNIGMPCSNLLCASWDRELTYETGRVIAEEARENDIQMILATAMNIHRNPLCGRHPEYFSEDPLLGGILAGFQCKGLEDQGISASMKHVVCNNSESSRKRNQSVVSQRALREIYLRVFETAFDIHRPDTVMTGYNALNGCFTAEDEELLTGIFRNEFGFEGFVMTDWNSYDTADIPSAVNAGNCWFTPGSEDDTYVKPILEAAEKGTLDTERLRSNVKYLLRVIRSRTQ